MSEFLIVGIIGICILIALFFTGMPVAYVMSIVGFLGYSYLTNWEAGALISPAQGAKLAVIAGPGQDM